MSKKRKLSKQGLENIRKAAKKRWAKQRAVKGDGLSSDQHDVVVSVETPDASSFRKGGANSRQVGGSHYKGRKIEPWDFAIANDLDFMQGSVVRYVVRYRDKNGIEDLRKAQHCLEKMIETELSRISDPKAK